MSNIFIMCFSKKGSGPAFTLSMAKGFRQNGNHVYCLLSSGLSNKSEWEKYRDEMFNVLFIDTGNRKDFISSSVKLLSKYKKQIRQFICGVNIDISIQTFVHPWMMVITDWIKPKHSMVICHDPFVHSGESKINALLSQYQYKKAKEIIVLTKSFIPVVENKFKKSTHDIYYIPHGIFEEYREYNNLPEKLIYESDKTNFLFFGRIEQYKGIEVLLKAYNNAFQINNKISLTIAGSGDVSQYSQLIKKAPNLLLINRFINDDEVGCLFNGPNLVLVVPYIDATQSGVIPIAVDFGIPVIASETGGLKEQLDDGKTGIFTKPGDIEDLKDAILKISCDSSIYRKQQQGINNMKSTIEWSSICNRLINEIQSRND